MTFLWLFFVFYLRLFFSTSQENVAGKIIPEMTCLCRVRRYTLINQFVYVS